MPHDSTWFRFFDDFYRHPKTRRLTNDQRTVVTVCWCIASRSHERGVLWATSTLPTIPADIADEARLPIEVVEEALGTIDRPGPVTQKGMFVSWRGDGVLYIPSWNEEQFTIRNDPTNAERQRRHRSRQREERSPPEPDE